MCRGSCVGWQGTPITPSPSLYPELSRAIVVTPREHVETRKSKPRVAPTVNRAPGTVECYTRNLHSTSRSTNTPAAITCQSQPRPADQILTAHAAQRMQRKSKTYNACVSSRLGRPRGYGTNSRVSKCHHERIMSLTACVWRCANGRATESYSLRGRQCPPDLIDVGASY